MNLPTLAPNAIISFLKQSTTIQGIAILVAIAIAYVLHQIDSAAAISTAVGAMILIVMQQEPDLSKLPAAVAQMAPALSRPAVLEATALQLAPAVVHEMGTSDPALHKALDLLKLLATQLQSQGASPAAAAPPVDLAPLASAVQAISDKIDAVQAVVTAPAAVPPAPPATILTGVLVPPAAPAAAPAATLPPAAIPPA